MVAIDQIATVAEPGESRCINTSTRSLQLYNAPPNQCAKDSKEANSVTRRHYRALISDKGQVRRDHILREIAVRNKQDPRDDSRKTEKSTMHMCRLRDMSLP